MDKLLLALFLSLLTLMASSRPSIAADAKPDPQVIQAFLVDQCPTEVKQSDVVTNALGGLVSSLVGFGIDKMLDAFGKSLTEAAEKDANGVAKSARVPAYLYGVNPIGVTKKFEPRLMTCIVVAKAPNGPSDWCQEPALKNLSVCNSGPDNKPLLATVLQPIPGAEPPSGTGKLTFYAEVRLMASTDQRGFIPVLNALYYPVSVSPEESKFKGTATRDLSITVSGSTPGGESALSAVNVHLQEITPSALLLRRHEGDADKVFAKAVTPMWVGVIKTPTYKKPPGMPDSGTGTYDNRAFPVNLAVELREIGKPREYLKLLAALFGKYKGQIAEELKAHMPDAIESAKQAEALAQLDASSKYQSAVADAYKAIAALDVACEKPTTASPDAGRSAVLQNFYASTAAVGVVRKIEATNSISPAMTFKVESAPDAGKTAFAICQSVK